jgi:hypothetical protein
LPRPRAVVGDCIARVRRSNAGNDGVADDRLVPLMVGDVASKLVPRLLRFLRDASLLWSDARRMQ